MAKILVIDDERSVRNTLKDILEYEGYEVALASSAKDGYERSSTANFDFVLCEAKYCDMDGEDIFDAAGKRSAVMVLSRESDTDKIVSYMSRGAADFLEKPINLNRLLGSIKNNLDRVVENAVEEAKAPLKEIVDTRKAGSVTAAVRRKHAVGVDITGSSPKIEKIREIVGKVAPSMARVLINGDNGTGKEVVAKMIHDRSPRRDGPFVEVNCAAIPSELIESELFGHEKGAFTSAVRQRKGKFEQADGGTLFLDEIGDMSLAAQAKVLRALQESRVSRVGSDKDINVNVRVIAATNKNLREEIERRTFREDLFHRLSVVILKMPSLNERIEDIPVFVDTFADEICREYGVPCKEFSKEAIDELKRVNWTGNIRQLRNVVERLIILGQDTVSLEDVKSYVSGV